MSTFANYLFEVGMLNRTPRSGLALLGFGHQTVSEHTFRTLHIAWLLARMSTEPIDELHLLHLVLFHDLLKARSGDFNCVNERYNKVDEEKLYADLEKGLPYGKEIVALLREFEEGSTPEARIANDADQLEVIATLKEQQDLGKARGTDWNTAARARLKTTAAQKLAAELTTTPSDDWWFHNKQDQHWVDRGRKPVE